MFYIRIFRLSFSTALALRLVGTASSSGHYGTGWCSGSSKVNLQWKQYYRPATWEYFI